MLLVGAAVFGGLILATELGFRLGRRRLVAAGEAGPVGAVQGGVLGILGLLLAFSFGGAATRSWNVRTSWCRRPTPLAPRSCGPTSSKTRTGPRAGRFSPVPRSRGSRCFTNWTRTGSTEDWPSARSCPGDVGGRRLGGQALAGGRGGSAAAAERGDRPAHDAARGGPAPHAHRRDRPAGPRRVPLACCDRLPGRDAGKRNASMTEALILLVGLALWATIDMDYPRVGGQMNRTPMLDVREVCSNGTGSGANHGCHTPVVTLRFNKFLPYWAVLQTDLKQTLHSWVYRLWVVDDAGRGGGVSALSRRAAQGGGHCAVRGGAVRRSVPHRCRRQPCGPGRGARGQRGHAPNAVRSRTRYSAAGSADTSTSSRSGMRDSSWSSRLLLLLPSLCWSRGISCSRTTRKVTCRSSVGWWRPVAVLAMLAVIVSCGVVIGRRD